MTYNPKTIKVINQRDLNNLHPDVAYLADLFTKKANEYLITRYLTIKVISTLRSWEEQQKIYNQGRTTPGPIVSNAKPGSSIHNWGCAFDCGVFRNGEYLDGAIKKDANGKDIPDEVKRKLAQDTHIEISKIGKSLGLTWGGDWINIKDLPHYQYTGKYDNNTFLKLANSGTPIDDLLDPLGALIQKLQKEGKI